MMRVVFLDIDGVLNNAAWQASRGGLGSQLRDLDVANVARLERLCIHTQAGVVVSSGWRESLAFADLCHVFRRHGFTAPILGTTPILREARGEEIQAWLDGWPDGPAPAVRAFVILDDCEDMGHLAPRLVRTDWHTGGLLNEHVERAVQLLEAAP